MPFRKIRETKTAPKIVLVGNFGAGNIGDELILAGFLKKLGKELPLAKVTVLAGEPNLVRRFHGVDALPHLPTGWRSFWRGGWWRSWRKIRESDAVIFPGGGLFTDEESWRAILIWGFHVLAARFYWKPVFLLGQSVGKFKKKWTRDFTRFCLAKTEWIAVRDSASAAELRKLMIPVAKIKLGRDSSFWLINRTSKSKKPKRRGVIKILLSLREFPGIEKKFWAELTKALDEITEKYPARITFASFGKGDEEVWKKIKHRAKNSTGWKKIDLPESAGGVLQQVSRFDLVIGMRLHSIVVARLTKTPAIAFNYSRKVGEFAERSLEIEDFEAQKLVKMFG